MTGKPDALSRRQALRLLLGASAAPLVAGGVPALAQSRRNALVIGLDFSTR